MKVEDGMWVRVLEDYAAVNPHTKKVACLAQAWAERAENMAKGGVPSREIIILARHAICADLREDEMEAVEKILKKVWEYRNQIWSKCAEERT